MHDGRWWLSQGTSVSPVDLLGPFSLFRFSDVPFYRTPFPTGYGSPHLILLTTSFGPTDIKQSFFEGYLPYAQYYEEGISFIPPSLFPFCAPAFPPPAPFFYLNQSHAKFREEIKLSFSPSPSHADAMFSQKSRAHRMEIHDMNWSMGRMGRTTSEAYPPEVF